MARPPDAERNPSFYQDKERVHGHPTGVPEAARIDGKEVDNDAFIEALADIRAGVAPSEKIYIKRSRRRKEIAVAFLADLSASPTPMSKT